MLRLDFYKPESDFNCSAQESRCFTAVEGEVVTIGDTIAAWGIENIQSPYSFNSLSARICLQTN
jgi:hypothetical protein